jgi:hypothetical protein
VAGQDSNKKPVPPGSVPNAPSGRALWKRAVDTGRHAIDSTSRLLHKLDLTSLRILGDDEKPLEKRGAGDAPARPAKSIPSFGGPREADPLPAKRHEFNPYDTRTPTGRGVSLAPRSPTPARPRITQPVRPARKPGILARLFRRGGK